MAGKITLDEALRNADSRNNLRLRIDLNDSSRTATQSDHNEFGGLTLRPKE